VWLPERRELYNAPTVLYTGLTFLYAQTVDARRSAEATE